MLGSLGHGGMKLGSWRGYTRQALMPEFGATLGFRFEIDLGLLADHEHLLLPGFAAGMSRAPEPSTRITLDLQAGPSGFSPFFGEKQVGYDASAPGLNRVLFAPGVQRQLSDDAAVNVSAVFANQRFASWGMGSWEAQDNLDYAYSDPSLREATAGTGVRFGFTGELAEGVRLGLGYQSRIEMDAFENYRGVYAEPGDFDIPSSATVGLIVEAGERSSVYVDVQRVLYSDINAFTTAGLPDRFLSLLGDAGSPDFRWRDLTVDSLGWNFASSDRVDWHVQYSTRQEPAPTSDLLYQVLEPELADSNVTFGLSRKTGRDARVDFNASYAASDYYLGPVSLGHRPEAEGDRFEFELRLVWEF